ncbi:MAG TPA: glycosyltransferase family 1 protein, partial [Jatrophihabitantaceae bacterium]|nr:glycosyltransferase family 1 protein [Jatrophihabitantaceae bacterium]
MVRVLVDATALPTNRGGVGRYLDGLLGALAGSAGSGAQVVVASKPADRAGYEALGLEVVTGPGVLDRRPVRLGWEQTGLLRVARRVRPDVLHSPHYTQPVFGRLPTVVTVHDATFFTDPQLHSVVKARFFRAATRWSARRATGLIVPSEATRRELARHAHVAVGRVTVAPLGVDRAVFHPPAAEDVVRLRRQLDLGDAEFVAFLGTVEPRKNVSALVRGWALAVRDLPHPPALVVAGGHGWDDTVDAAAAGIPNRLRVIRPGYLPMADLPALLGGAAVVVYPSLGEGFGLPVLEAMACGATVLTTRRLALPEVGGDAVAYTEP